MMRNRLQFLSGDRQDTGTRQYFGVAIVHAEQSDVRTSPLRFQAFDDVLQVFREAHQLCSYAREWQQRLERIDEVCGAINRVHAPTRNRLGIIAQRLHRACLHGDTVISRVRLDVGMCRLGLRGGIS